MLEKTATLNPQPPVTGIKKFKQVTGGLAIMIAIGYGVISAGIWVFTPSTPTTLKEISDNIVRTSEVTNNGKKLLKIDLK